MPKKIEVEYTEKLYFMEWLTFGDMPGFYLTGKWEEQ